MNITHAIYYFAQDGIAFGQSPITKETAKYYYTQDENRFQKERLGKIQLYSATNYPYIMVCMVDADKETLRQKIREWFDRKADEICPKQRN